MTFGEEGKEGARVHNLKDVEAILDAFVSHGHTEVDMLQIPILSIVYGPIKYLPHRSTPLEHTAAGQAKST